MSTDSDACYVREENTIYLLKGINLDKTSDDYIITVHELSHAARTASYTTADGVKGRGTFLLARINCQGVARYTPYMSIDFKDFQPLYEDLAELYFSTHITTDMSYDEARDVFDEFYSEITFNFENVNRKYTINEDTFLPAFEEYIKEIGISNGKSLN